MEETIKDNTMDIAASIKDAFDEKSILPRFSSYAAVSKFKSVRRAIRRGHVDLFFGIIFPNRPFNNRKATPGRAQNYTKKRMYGQFKLQ
jgi:hypothetical protein